MQAGVGLIVTDMIPIYMIIAMNNIITLRFSINCSTIISLPTVRYLFERKASSENYGPQVYFYHITKTKNTLLRFIYFYCTLQFIHLPLSNLILASNEFKGIDNPPARVGCKYLLLCVYVLLTRNLRGSPIGSITLVLTEGNTYLYCTASPFLFG